MTPSHFPWETWDPGLSAFSKNLSMDFDVLWTRTYVSWHFWDVCLKFTCFPRSFSCIILANTCPAINTAQSRLRNPLVFSQ